MSMIEEQLHGYLDTQITAVSGRVYAAGEVPQGGPLPRITYQKISGPRVNTKQGQTGLAYPRFQVSVWAPSYGEAKTIANDVRKAMNAFPNGYARMEDETDTYESDTEIHGCLQDFVIGHNEEVT